MHFFRLFRRYEIEAAFIFAVLVLLAAGLASYGAIDAAKGSVGWVRHTYQVIGSIDKSFETLALVHSSGRSYALTGDKRYERVNRDAVMDATAAVLNLTSLVRDNPEQSARIPQLQNLFDRIVARSQSVIAARTNFGAEAAISLLQSGEGSRALEDLRLLTGE